MIKDTIINADILEVLPTIPDNTFDCCILDVPYEQEAHGRGFASKRGIYKEMSEYTSLDNDWYSANLIEEYIRICKFPNLFCFGSKRDVASLLRYAEDKKLFYDIIPVCKKLPLRSQIITGCRMSMLFTLRTES